MKITTTLLKQIIKEELAALEEGPTKEWVATNKIHTEKQDAEAALDKLENKDDFKVIEITAYKLSKK